MNLVQQFGTTRRQFLARLRHFDDRSDFFIVQRHLEKFYAIHYAPTGWRSRVAWYAYRTLLALIYLTYVEKAVWVAQHWGDSTLFNASNVFGVLWFFSAVMLRVAILEWHHPLQARMHAFLNDHSYRRHDPWTRTRRAQFYRRTNQITLGVMAVNLLEIVCFAATNVIALEDFMLQYRGRILGGMPLQIVYGVLTMCWGGTYCLGFLICHLLMSTFEMETDVLLHALEELGRELRFKGRLQEDEVFWDGLIDKLRPHIHRLMSLFDNLQTLKSIINPIAFVQYYSTYLVLADCCLILATGSMSSYSIVYVVSMLVFLTEAFLLSRGVENLRNLKPRIAATLYDFDWTLQLRRSDRRFEPQYRHVRRTFLLLTAHSGQTIRFSFAGIGEISMNSFSELLNKTYSMLTFLLQFAK